MRTKVLAAILYLVMVASGTVLDAWHEIKYMPPAEMRQSQDILVDMVGDIRTVLARYLWFRMDLFHEVLDEQGVDPEEQIEVFPLLRMVTVLDPSMTESYDQIVWDLYKGQGDKETALALLTEGLSRNPNDYQLNFRRALLAYLEEDYKTARDYAGFSMSLTTDKVSQADCLRIIYHSAVKEENIPLQERALNDLLYLRPNDALWLREKEKLEERKKEQKKDS